MRTPKEEELAKRFRDIELYAPLIGVEDEELIYVASTSDYSVGLKLFQHREHLATHMRLILDWCEDRFENWPKSNKISLNVGAHIGTAVIPLVYYGYFDSAIAFEPEPLNAKLLRANLALNGVEQDIAVHELALWDCDATMSMYLSEHNHGAYAIFDRECALAIQLPKRHEEDWTEIKVECQTLDHFVDDHGIELEQIGLVVMDIEGGEGHFFEGAQGLLEQRIPIITELWPYFLRRSGGVDKFSNNVFGNFSKFVNCSHPKKWGLKVCDIGDLNDLIVSDKFSNIVLIP